MKRVIIYGIGNNCNIFRQYAFRRDFEVVAYVDRNKTGQIYQGSKIKAPEEIKNLEYDELFLMLAYEKETVKDWLVDKLGVERGRIRDTIYLNTHYMLCDLAAYEYVFFTDSPDYLNIPYKDLETDDRVTFRSTLWTGEKWKSGDIVQECKCHFLFRSHCFNKHYREGFYEYIRENYPNSKRILILSDICKGEFGYESTNPGFSVEYIKKIFNLIITYHEAEAKRYGFEYNMQVFSKLDLPVVEECTDAFFVGNAKNRLDVVHNLYLKMKEKGLKCNFWINGVEPEQRLPSAEGITYNQTLSYMDYLREMMKSRCIIEICQIGDETSMRFAEAVIYNKRLLINDTSCKRKKYYNEVYMKCFEDVNLLDLSWLEEKSPVEYNYKGDFSPDCLLQLVDNYFS